MALVVFYNTKCPVCDAGISFQRNRLLEAVRSGQVEFRDINLEPEVLARFGAGIEDIRKRLHALKDGQLLVGADVAMALWRVTRGHEWLAKLFGNALMLPVSRLSYNLFAELLYFWNRRLGHW